MAVHTYKKLVDAIVRRDSSLYDVVYFHGCQESIRPLLDSIVREYSKSHPSQTVIRISGDEFRDDLIHKLSHGYRVNFAFDCDLLIFEDIDQVAGRESIEEYLYGYLDRLLESKQQFIVTGAAPTAQILPLAERIRAQIDGGVSFHIE